MNLETEVKYEKQPFIAIVMGVGQRMIASLGSKSQSADPGPAASARRFGNASAHRPPEGLVKMQILIPQVWGGAQEALFLQIAQVMLMLLVAGHTLSSKDLEKDGRVA